MKNQRAYCKVVLLALSTLICGTVYGQGGTGKMPLPRPNNPMRKPPPPRRNPTVLPKVGPPDIPLIALSQGVQEQRLLTLDGESLKLSDYGDKLIVINLWATWVEPSRLEIPQLVKMGNEYKSRGLIVLGLATTYNENNDLIKVKQFVRAQKINYKVVWDDGTLASELVKLVKGQSVLPQTFVISRGNILKHFQGFNPNSTPALMRQTIEKNLAR